MGDKYLVSYEFKEKDGCWVTTKTETKIFCENELCNIAKLVDSHDNYLKIIFCQKL